MSNSFKLCQTIFVRYLKLKPDFKNLKMIKAKYIFLIVVTMAAWSCNQNEQIAAYITIEPFEFTPGDDNIQSAKISDAWIYVDNEFLGAFELPKDDSRFKKW